MKYVIEFEKILNQWVVFKVDKSLKVEVFRNKYKKCCRDFIKTMEVKSGTKNRKNNNKKRKYSRN